MEAVRSLAQAASGWLNDVPPSSLSGFFTALLLKVSVKLFYFFNVFERNTKHTPITCLGFLLVFWWAAP